MIYLNSKAQLWINHLAYVAIKGHELQQKIQKVKEIQKVGQWEGKIKDIIKGLDCLQKQKEWYKF